MWVICLSHTRTSTHTRVGAYAYMVVKITINETSDIREDNPLPQYHSMYFQRYSFHKVFDQVSNIEFKGTFVKLMYLYNKEAKHTRAAIV